jgi:hypothetical protein
VLEIDPIPGGNEQHDQYERRGGRWADRVAE